MHVEYIYIYTPIAMYVGQVQNNTHSIQTLTGQISKLVGTMEAEKDFQHCRKMVDDAVRQVLALPIRPIGSI